MHIRELQVGEFVVGCWRISSKVKPGGLERAPESQLPKPPTREARSSLDYRLRRTCCLQTCHQSGWLHRSTIGHVVSAQVGNTQNGDSCGIDAATTTLYRGKSRTG